VLFKSGQKVLNFSMKHDNKPSSSSNQIERNYLKCSFANRLNDIFPLLSDAWLGESKKLKKKKHLRL
jgi:hypothetical protein